MKPSPVVEEGSDKASESGSEVGSLVGFTLQVQGSGVGYVKRWSLGDSSSLESSGKINRGI